MFKGTKNDLKSCANLKPSCVRESRKKSCPMSDMFVFLLLGQGERDERSEAGGWARSDFIVNTDRGSL